MPSHIAFLHKDFPYSGAEKVTALVAGRLCALGYRVTVLCQHHHPELYGGKGALPYDVAPLPPGRIKSSRRVARAVRDFVKANGVAVVVTYRELFYARRLRRATGVRLVYELHNTPRYEYLDIVEKGRTSLFYRVQAALLTPFYLQKYKRIYRWADAYGVLCAAYGDELCRMLHLPEPNKIWVLPNPLPRPDSYTALKRKTIVYVGRLSRRDKRVDRLLRIWQKAQSSLPEGWCLKIVGAGKDGRRLRAQAAALCLRGVTFEGAASDVQPYYDEAAMLCLTSTFEGWPMSVAEAQANGVVPIVFDSFAGARDMIDSGVDGFLVKPFDEEAFACRIVALARDGARLTAMGAAARAKSAAYSIARSGKAWDAMLTSLTNHPEP